MPNDERFDLRLPKEEKQLFEEAAAVETLPVSLWIRRVLKREATRLLAKDGMRSATGVFDKKKGR